MTPIDCRVTLQMVPPIDCRVTLQIALPINLQANLQIPPQIKVQVLTYKKSNPVITIFYIANIREIF